MSQRSLRVALSMVVLALALGACAHQGARDDASARSSREPAAPALRATAPPAERAPPAAAPAPAPSVPASVSEPVPAEPIGVVACDAYLGRYRACHRTIKAFALEDIDERFTRARRNFLEQARDPAQHETLAQTCESLDELMDEALNGRDCDEAVGDFVGADQ